MADSSKRARLAVFFEKLKAASPASTHDEAFDLLAAVLNEVENELTTIPFNPSTWQTDGRMYPPQPDSVRDVAGYPTVKRYRSVGHNTLIADNGAIEIMALPFPGGKVLFSKLGADGKDVWGK